MFIVTHSRGEAPAEKFLKVNFISLNSLRHYELNCYMGIVKLRFTKTRVEECGGKATTNRNDSKTKCMGVGNWEGHWKDKGKDYTDLRRWN